MTHNGVINEHEKWREWNISGWKDLNKRMGERRENDKEWDLKKTK